MASSLWRIPVIPALLLGSAGRGAEEAVIPEYQLKAMFLWRIAALVQFPPKEQDQHGGGVFAIGVLGISPFRSELQKLIDNKTVRGIPIRVKYGRRVEELSDCRVVFICGSEEYLIPEILDQLRGLPILTVSDSQYATLKGVMVNFSLDHRHLGLEVNLEAVKSSGLVFSSYLLKNAKVVR